MSLMLMAALQAAAVPGPIVRSDFDLAELRSAQREGLDLDSWRGCRGSALGEILVCGRPPRREDYPMEEMERVFATEPIVAEMRLGGAATGSAFVDAVALDRGAVSNRIMLGITLPF